MAADKKLTLEQLMEGIFDEIRKGLRQKYSEGYSEGRRTEKDLQAARERATKVVVLPEDWLDQINEEANSLDLRPLSDVLKEAFAKWAADPIEWADPDYHNCHFCGEFVANGYTSDNKRHWLSDCRPDLVEHEPGEACTWSFKLGQTDPDGNPYEPRDTCYAYQDRSSSSMSSWAWTNEHKHFDEDGPM